MTQPQPFQYRLRVRYAECDAQGVVFNARYADYVDLAINEYIRTLFGDYQRLLERDLDVQVVSMNLNWQAPARFDDVLCVDVLPGRIGNSAFGVSLRFHDYAAGHAIADASVTYVMVVPSRGGKTPIPGDLREKLAAGAPGQCISHAGEAPRPER
ncbi:MAG: thioesterase family protein [Oleiphilaceae bacterium]|nr:thioesterase family protein [Oleiphilaceae bacterium]